MGIEDLLSIRCRERAELLIDIEKGIRRDSRVRAAWVTGSVAWGEDDALSDLDIFVVVADDDIHDFVENRRVHAAEPARPVLLMDNLANAPVGGAYLLALYEGEVGPQHVDWFWQAQSETHRPDQAKVLFDRAGFSCVSSGLSAMHGPSGPPLCPNPSLTDLLTHKIAFFWAMSLIVAKYIARRNGETVARMTGVVTRTLTEAATLCHNNSVPLEANVPSVAFGLETMSATAQLQMLRELAGYAEALGFQLCDRGAVVPTEAMRQVYRFFELAESLADRDVDLRPCQ